MTALLPSLLVLQLLGCDASDPPAPGPADVASPGIDSGQPDTAADKEPPEPVEVTAEVVEGLGTVVRVYWEHPEAAPTRLAFRVVGDSDWMHSPVVDTAAGPASQLILGVPFDADVEYRVLSGAEETALAPAQTVRTGPRPEMLPEPIILANDPTLWSEDTPYIITSMNSAGDSRYGLWWVFVMNRDGEVVWAQQSGEDWISRHVSVSHSQQRLLVDHNTAWSLLDGGQASTIVEMTLDGTIHHTYPTPGLHHAFVPLPEDRLAWAARYARSERLMTIGRDGAVEEVWDCQTFQTEVLNEGNTGWGGFPGDKDASGMLSTCGSNALWWHEETDRFLYSFWSYDTVLEIDHQSGELVRSFGQTPGSWSFSPQQSAFWWQHGALYTAAGTLLVSTKDRRGGTETLVREYALDEEKQQLIEVWSFGEGRGIYGPYMGEAHRLANGNTLHIYGAGGHMAEVTALGEIAWEVTWEGDQHNGHTTLWDDLYALLP